MSKLMDDYENKKQLYCTPPHITKALLKREVFPGMIWEPAAGRGHIVRVLRECGYTEIVCSDINDWGFDGCRIEDFLTTTRKCDCIVTNPPHDRLMPKFVAKAKLLARHKIAMLLPVQFEHTVEYVGNHLADADFPWKAEYTFPQTIRWENVHEHHGYIKHAWFVFERGYRGPVIREPIMFRRNRPLSSSARRNTDRKSSH